MSIRKYKKDHLKEHAQISLAKPFKTEAPVSGDPLVFWTQHEKEPIEVNLHPFSTGQENSHHTKAGGRKFIAFSGRPKLIRQLAPAIEDALLYSARTTVKTYFAALREWWRVLDAVEKEAANAGQPIARVDDVRLLMPMHSDFAHRSGMSRQRFSIFRSHVDTTCMALGVRQTYWESPEEPDTQKKIPPKEQRNAIRFAVRGACRSVIERWEQSDQLSEIETEPSDFQEAKMWRHLRYMRDIQKLTKKPLPKPNDLTDVIPSWALNTHGNFKLSVRGSVFPSKWDADAVWHQCLLCTGWNSTTLTTLDVTKKFLFDHFKDDASDVHRRYVLSPQTYQLVGVKERAEGREQFVTGQWKTLDGPGHLIKTYLKRVEPLREVLKEQLEQEKLKYEQMKDSDYKTRTEQFARIKNLEQGVRSVWLYVNKVGNVGWIVNESGRIGNFNGKKMTFLDEVLERLNIQRSTTNARRAENNETLLEHLAPIPHVAPKQFRLWFADYVYRASHGNLLQVKRALNHSHLDTTVKYTNTNALNQEASDAARRFLNILVGELDVGRVDLTILAHLYRHGTLTPEHDVLLTQARTLPMSRLKVACKDPRTPPSHIKATENQPCDVQRCLLCVEHAVLLPESMDGIAMRVEELRALQGFLPLETWIEDKYDIELKNNLMALRKFHLNQVLVARKKWERAIVCGEHYVPGLPLTSSAGLMELV